MNLYQGRFVIAREKDGDTWAELSSDGVRIMKGKILEPDKGIPVLTIAADQIQRLEAWAQPQALTVPFTGLLAKQIRELAVQVGLTPQNFVVEAVNAFIQAGEMAEQASPTPQRPRQSPQSPQEITFEGLEGHEHLER